MVKNLHSVEFFHSTSFATQSIFVYGSWDNFANGTSMKEEGRTLYRCDVKIPEGVHLYRYLVDGKWEGPTFGQRVERGEEIYGVKFVDGQVRTLSYVKEATIPNARVPSMKPATPKTTSAQRSQSSIAENTRFESRVESLADMFNAKGVEIGEYYDVKVDRRQARKKNGAPSKVKSVMDKFASIFSKKKQPSSLRPSMYNYDNN
ncbi:hypothetical protein NDN08_002758 [Rhodosorus marinus]|uniref:AMP-activated protein kinase glycogen-binding domain-containing protein n=1 Tax=Rhodosorus marinus TaxID=101924 RepID=A0AAV8UUN4_9RHOD|nr:hypothetical protein NDN08_002758 [Rhodosorus marinus]